VGAIEVVGIVVGDDVGVDGLYGAVEVGCKGVQLENMISKNENIKPLIFIAEIVA